VVYNHRPVFIYRSRVDAMAGARNANRVTDILVAAWVASAMWPMIAHRWYPAAGAPPALSALVPPHMRYAPVMFSETLPTYPAVFLNPEGTDEWLELPAYHSRFRRLAMSRSSIYQLWTNQHDVFDDECKTRPFNVHLSFPTAGGVPTATAFAPWLAYEKKSMWFEEIEALNRDTGKYGSGTADDHSLLPVRFERAYNRTPGMPCRAFKTSPPLGYTAHRGVEAAVLPPVLPSSQFPAINGGRAPPRPGADSLALLFMDLTLIAGMTMGYWLMETPTDDKLCRAMAPVSRDMGAIVRFCVYLATVVHYAAPRASGTEVAYDPRHQLATAAEAAFVVYPLLVGLAAAGMAYCREDGIFIPAALYLLTHVLTAYDPALYMTLGVPHLQLLLLALALAGVHRWENGRASHVALRYVWFAVGHAVMVSGVDKLRYEWITPPRGSGGPMCALAGNMAFALPWSTGGFRGLCDRAPDVAALLGILVVAVEVIAPLVAITQWGSADRLWTVPNAAAVALAGGFSVMWLFVSIPALFFYLYTVPLVLLAAYRIRYAVESGRLADEARWARLNEERAARWGVEMKKAQAAVEAQAARERAAARKVELDLVAEEQAEPMATAMGLPPGAMTTPVQRRGAGKPANGHQ
jgi:uncharacterized membrane protein